MTDQTSELRWQFSDTSVPETYTFRINPNTAASPYTVKEFDKSSGADGQVSLFMKTPKTPKEWVFGGVIRSQAQHDEFARWANKKKVIRIRTHQNHVFEAIIQAFNPEDRKPTPNLPWRFSYTMTCYVLGQVS